MHYNNRRQAYWWILVFALACLGWQSHAIANNQCLATDNGIYGEAELQIESGVTMNGYNVDSGNTNDNGINSTGSINNPSITLTSMGSESFGTTNIDLYDNDVLSPGSYGEVEVKEGSDITMQAGDYYIDYFDVKENVTIILDGPVTIHVGKFDLDNDVEMNGPYNNTNPVTTNGDAANLTVKWYGGGTEDNKFHLHDDVKFTGIIYSTGVGGNEGVKFHKRAKFFGGIFTDNIIKIGEDTEFTYGTNEQEAAAAVLGCESLLGQCSAVFPDGASTHSDSGTISFGFNAQLIDSDNNQLATIGVSKNGGSNVNTCDTADCVATGTPSDTAPTINFQTTTSTVDVTVGFQGSVVMGNGSFSGNEFDDINPGSSSEANITFSDTHSEYFVDSLILGFDNTLYLQAGASYWINQLTMESQADIIVQGSGTAFIYVNQNLSFPSPGLINSPSNNNSGDASKLIMYVFSDVTFNNQSTYTGSLYVEGDLTLISSSHAFGSISAANIDLGSQSTITYQSEEIADTDFGSLCTDVVIAPYQITGHPKSITGGDDWSWNGSYIVDWRAAMEDANNFGEGGVVSKVIESVDLSSLNASSLSTVDAFVSTWWSSSQSSSYHSMLRDFFLAGGDLILLQDDNSHDGIGEFLGIEAISGMSNPTTISSPLQDGPFGAVGSITLNDGASHLDSAKINTLGGTICGADQSQQATFACWEEGEYALGAGKLVIITDTEFVTTISNEANYSSLNDKGKLALNVLEFLVRTPQTPTPLIDYHFDEMSWTGSANEVIDSSGNNYNGTAIGGITTATGKICNAAQIPNNNSASIYEAVDTGVDLDTVIGSSGTISLWYKGDSDWNSGTDKRLFDATDGDKYFFAEIGADGRVKFRFEDGNDGDYQRTTDNAFSVGAGVWKHLTFVWDVSNITAKIFVDGVEQSVSSGSNADGGTTAFSGYDTLYFGDNRDASYFTGESSADGLIDEALVFDSVLTKTQIQTIFTNQDAGNNWDGTTRVCPANPLDHFEILHDGNGFTCEAKTVTIKACANEDCSIPYTEPVSITLSPSGWDAGDTITFGNPHGEITTTLSVTDETTITLAKSGASPDADLRCYIGSAANCDLTFSNDGFEIYGANFGDSLPDQLAANNFLNVNLRAVRSNNNVCEALLIGLRKINLTYNCDSPDTCLTPLNGISIAGDGSGESTGIIEVEFDALGVANLAVLNYPDAGRLTLRVQAEVDGVTITNSDIETVDVYPSYLKLAVDQSELLYSSSGAQNNYVAGEPFTVSIGAYSVNNALLPNYQAENPQLKVTRIQPASAGTNGKFKYSNTGINTAQLTAGFTPATGLSFSAGEHQFTTAYYDEVGRINVDVKDNSYLGNVILSNGSITLGDFYPAYFGVALSATPSLADTCGIFSYIGETITFATNPELTITAYNALNVITENYSDDYWNYLPNESTLEANLSFMDTSTYHLTGTASVIDLGDAPLIANNDNYNGSGTVTITNGRFRYNKVDPLDNSAFAAVSPFEAEISLAFSSDFFSSTFIDQNGNQDTICFQASYSDNTCLEWDIEEITGAQMRYGRLTLESTYGPEVEPLNVPIKAEYFNNDQWLLNTDDSNCTSIALTETAGQIVLTAIDGYDLDLVGDVKSDGVLILGVPVGNQFQLKAPDPSQLGPGTQGQMELSLYPTAIGVEWPNHLNYDWDGDGFIDNDDFPKATITFGQFRGNDRIIQWREVSN